MRTVRELGPQALVKSFFGPLEDKGDIPPKHLESGRADGYEKCLRRRATFGEGSLRDANLQNDWCEIFGPISMRWAAPSWVTTGNPFQ